jgi:hypothetical protein
MDAEPRQSSDGIRVDRHRGIRRTRIDARTRAGRRARELREYFTAILAGAGRDVSAVELASAVSRAAELQAISESMRADAVRGLPISADDLVRIERLSAQATRWLRLPTAAASKNATPTLAEYLAGTREAAE